MRCATALATAILGLMCISAARPPTCLHIYGAVLVGDNPTLLRARDHALAHCLPEAESSLLGDARPGTLAHTAALNACLSRMGFIENGTVFYPTRIGHDYHHQH